ncbi:methyltransferase, partial [Streptomyces sp. NRRL S-444]
MAARRYYGTADVDAFYAEVWGGEDIHTGVYADRNESVAVASRRTVELAAAKVAGRLGPGHTVLD